LLVVVVVVLVLVSTVNDGEKFTLLRAWRGASYCDGAEDLIGSFCSALRWATIAKA
jgi:hypothetical protein